MSLVKLTEKQAKALEDVKIIKGNSDDVINHYAEMRWESEEFKCLNSISVSDLAKALYKGYEIKNKLKEGDTLYHPWTKSLGTLKDRFVYWDDGIKNDEDYAISLLECGDVRFATPDDIKCGKEKKFWKKHKREPWELKQGDILMGVRRHLYEVTGTPISNGNFYYTGNDNYDFDIEECRRENWEVICFKEDRLDIK